VDAESTAGFVQAAQRAQRQGSDGDLRAQDHRIVSRSGNGHSGSIAVGRHAPIPVARRGPLVADRAVPVLPVGGK
jgi:hypothetical protein